MVKIDRVDVINYLKKVRTQNRSSDLLNGGGLPVKTLN